MRAAAPDTDGLLLFHEYFPTARRGSAFRCRTRLAGLIADCLWKTAAVHGRVRR